MYAIYAGNRVAAKITQEKRPKSVNFSSRQRIKSAGETNEMRRREIVEFLSIQIKAKKKKKKAGSHTQT